MGLRTVVEVIMMYLVQQALIKHTDAMHWARREDSKDELDKAFAAKGAPRTRQVKLEVKICRGVNMRECFGGKLDRLIIWNIKFNSQSGNQAYWRDGLNPRWPCMPLKMMK